MLLREALYVMEPLARLLVAQGVTYPAFAQLLKTVFLNAAESELSDKKRKVTDSALSLLSGVHRKDVRALGAGQREPPSRGTSIADQVIVRWITQPDYIDENGVPKRLPIRSRDDTGLSFERLAQSVSKDFHSRSILDELERLGVVRIQDNEVMLVSGDGFVPSQDIRESFRVFGANIHDHLAAARDNLRAAQSQQRPPFLEYSMWADELSEESARELALYAQKSWFAAMRRVTDLALQLSDRDRANLDSASAVRFRFGGFTYHQAMSLDTPATDAPGRQVTGSSDRPDRKNDSGKKSSSQKANA